MLAERFALFAPTYSYYFTQENNVENKMCLYIPDIRNGVTIISLSRTGASGAASAASSLMTWTRLTSSPPSTSSHLVRKPSYLVICLLVNTVKNIFFQHVFEKKNVASIKLIVKSTYEFVEN